MVRGRGCASRAWDEERGSEELGIWGEESEDEEGQNRRGFVTLDDWNEKREGEGWGWRGWRCSPVQGMMM